MQSNCRKNSEITIPEGIPDSEQYRPLFETAVSEYGEKIITKNMSFSETVDMIFNDVSEK